MATSLNLYKNILEKLKNNNNIEQSNFIAKELILYHYGKHFSLDFLVESEDEISASVQRVINGEPLAYIFSEWDFMSHRFYVDKNVLIPRSDTEILVTTAINIIKKNNLKTALDICTGSGCIAISLALDVMDLDVLALEISKNAIIVAEKNNCMHKTTSRVKIKEFNLLKDTLQQHEKFDIIVSNPPYIKKTDVYNLSKSVIDYEPILALDGGEDGLVFYRIIAENFKNNLNENGFLLFESGYDNAEQIADILLENNYKNIQIKKDLANRNRVVIAERTANE